MTRFTKLLASTAAALTLAVGMTASGGAEAKHFHGGRGWGIGAGLLGAAIVGGAYAASRPAYGYGYGYAPAYGGDCYSVRRVNRFGELVYRRVCY